MSTALEENPRATAKKLPGEEGVWLFICGDMMVFALFFLTFVYYRNLDVATYVNSQKALNETLGLANTLLLLTSSWCVATAVQGARKGWGKDVSRLLAGGIACGLGFVGIKFVEYGEKFSHGISLLTNEFFMFYFMFTGIHLLHVLIGLAVLTFLFLKSRKPSLSEGDIQIIEGGGAFWHLVDLLWVVLFALLYLMR